MKRTTFKTTAMIAAAGLVTITMLAGGSAVGALIGFDRLSNVDKSDYIGIDRAKQLALEDAGFASTDVTFVDRECKFDGREYDIEFTAGDYKYEYEIRALDGTITDKDVERKKSASVTKPDTAVDKSDYIGIDRAKQIALEDAGFASTDVTFVDRECKLDGREYDVEFTAGDYKYEYEIRALDGTITDKDVERGKYDFDDDWDDDWDD